MDILRFQPNAARTLVLIADWTLLQGAPVAPVLQRSIHLSLPVGPSAAAQAAGMSQLLARLANHIASDIVSKVPTSPLASTPRM